MLRTRVLDSTPARRLGPVRRRFAALTAAVALTLLSACTGHPTSSPTPRSTGTTTTAVGTSTAAHVAGQEPGSQTSAPPAATTSTAETLPTLPALVVPEWKPTTRSEQLAMQISAEESATVQQAVDVFSISVATLPGATPSALPDGDGLGGTFALALIGAVRDRLTPDQRAIVEPYLNPVPVRGTRDTVPASGATTAAPAAGTTTATSKPGASKTPTSATGAATTATSKPGATTAHGGGHGPGRGVAYGPADLITTDPADLTSKYSKLLTQVRQDWRAYRPAFPNPQPVLVMAAHDDKEGDDMDTWMIDAKDCNIRVFPEFYARSPAPTDQQIKQILAHEYFHCIQGSWENGKIHGPDWLIEGSADWASFRLYSPSYLPIAIYLKWFTSPGTPLGARSYDAWPLFQAIEQTGAAFPYAAIRLMLLSGAKGVQGVLAAAGLDTAPGFAVQSAAEALRPTLWSDDDATWRTHWPGPDIDAGNTDNAIRLPTRGIGAYPMVSRGKFTHIPELVPMTSQVGLVRVLGKTGPMVTHTHQGTVTVAEGQMRFFCVDEQECPCPEGMSPKIDMFIVAKPMMFSFPERENPTTVAVRAEKWNPKKYCGKSPPRREPGGDSNGDPHLVTFDGLHYDLMALGEFVTVKDPAGDLQVQTRHEAFPTWGSGTTAVAIGTGKHRMTITASGLEKNASTLIRVDGEPQNGQKFAVGSVNVTTDGTSVVAIWPDGSTVVVTWLWGYFVHVTLAPDRAKRVVGLLGSADHTFLDDLRLPDGSRPSDPDPNGQLAKAWYVTDATTLFDYGPGETTESFRGPPPPPPPPADAAIRKQCTDKLGPDATSYEILACEFDIQVTGDPDFADAYFHVVTVRIADMPQQLSGAPQTPRTVTTTSSAPAPTNAAGSGTMALSLNGIITAVPSGPDVKAALTGSITLVGGTVLIAKTPECRQGVDIVVTVTERSSGGSAEVYVCDPRGADHFDVDDGDLAPPGEGYLWIPTSGAYDVKVETFSDDQVPVSMHFYADPTPTVVDASEFVASGWSGSLSGVGDTVVLWGTNNSDYPVNWTYQGSKDLCRAVLPTDQTQHDPFDVGGMCRQQPQLNLGPNGSSQEPILIFSRTAGSSDATLRKGR